MNPRHRTQSRPSTSAPKIDVERLLRDSETASNETVKNALARAAEEEKKRQEDLIVGQFQQLQNSLTTSLNYLRVVRAQEKEQKEKVAKIGAAIEQFKKDADFEKAIKAIRGY